MKFRNVIITGASSGIGRALAVEFAKNRVPLLILSRRIEELEILANELSQYSGKIYFLKCDVTKSEDINNAISFAQSKFGEIDLAILCAGIDKNISAINFNHKTLSEVFETNVFGITRFIEKLLPPMLRSGGTIAGVTSLADARAFTGSSAYCSSKIAASFILESLRAELKRTKVKIVTIKPGFVRTPMTDPHNYYMPFLMDVDKAAKIIVSGLEKSKSRIYFPKSTAFLTYLLRAMPDSLYDWLAAGFISKAKGVSK